MLLPFKVNLTTSKASNASKVSKAISHISTVCVHCVHCAHTNVLRQHGGGGGAGGRQEDFHLATATPLQGAGTISCIQSDIFQQQNLTLYFGYLCSLTFNLRTINRFLTFKLILRYL